MTEISQELKAKDLQNIADTHENIARGERNRAGLWGAVALAGAGVLAVSIANHDPGKEIGGIIGIGGVIPAVGISRTARRETLLADQYRRQAITSVESERIQAALGASGLIEARVEAIERALEGNRLDPASIVPQPGTTPVVITPAPAQMEPRAE